MENKNTNTILVAIIVVLAVALVYFMGSTGKETAKEPGGSVQEQTATGTGEEAPAAKSDWQAVFLTNGQVYFGHVKSTEGQYISMTEIYYLQVQKSLQPPEEADTKKKTETADTATEEQPRLSLVKLGNELHGPTDEMTINRDHVLFLEDMKTNSRVVQAILKYKADQAKEK